MTKKWMKIQLSKDAILLHHNEELKQYDNLPRISDEIIKKIKESKKQNEKKFIKQLPNI